jgi:hypothetical protein
MIPKRIPNIDEVVEEVRKTDVAIIKHILTRGKLARISFHKVGRPSLVKVRTDVMEKLGILKSYAFGSIRTYVLVTKNVDLSDLPINSDRICIWKFPLYKIVYYIIDKYQPVGAQQIVDIFRDIMFSRGFENVGSKSCIREKVLTLGKHKLVRYDKVFKVWCTTDYRMYIDEHEVDKAIEDWIKHRSVLRNRGFFTESYEYQKEEVIL